MTIEAPTQDELRGIADEHGFHFDAEELAWYHGLLSGAFGAYGALDAAPSPLAEVPADRTYTAPSPEENPLNAWYVRTQIRGRGDGPLAGMSFAAKDNVMVAGVPLLNGSAIFEGYVAEVDATVVTRLLEAGATLAGKAHCEDLCLSGGSHTNITGPVHNPHKRGHSAGGSSSGSAALVAAGEVELAIGGDQGGSIRIPAALCGTVGMKPTWGLVPYTGIAPIEPSIDHVGPITANVRDNARMLEVMAGPDGIDMRQSGVAADRYVDALGSEIEGLRIAVVSEGFSVAGSEPAVGSAVRRAAEQLAQLGARVEEVSIPEHLEAGILTLPLMVEGMYRTVFRGGGQGTGRPDVYVPGFIERASDWQRVADRLSPIGKLLVLAGALVERRYGSRYYARAANQARRIRAAYDRVLASADVLLMPTTPMTAPPHPAPDAPIAEQFLRATETSSNPQPFNATHHPSLSIPCGRIDGLPVGLMLTGRHYDEATLYRTAYAFEQSVDWRTL